MKKRVLSMLLAIVMVLGLLPAAAPHVHAEEHICADNDYNHHCDEDSCREYINCYDREEDGRCDLCGACLTPVDENEDNVCDFCGYCMEHTFENGYWYNEGGYHYPECDRCMYYDYAAGTVCVDGDSDDLCDVCGTCVGTHDYTWNNLRDTESHQLVCSICHSENWEEHFDNNTDADCDICGTCMEHDETKTYVWDEESLSDDNGHYLVCNDCGIGWNWEEHSDGDDEDSFCDVCGSCEIGAHGDEVWNGIDRDEAKHFSKCSICGASFGWVEHSDKDGNGSCDVCCYCVDGEHSYGWDEENRNNWEHRLVCKDCGTNGGWEDHYDENGDGTCDVCDAEITVINIPLQLKAVNAEGEVITDTLDVMLSPAESDDYSWLANTTENYGNVYEVAIGENRLHGWDIYPSGYLKPTEEVTFTVNAKGNVTITSGNATVETTDTMTYIVITLEEDPNSGGSEGGSEDIEPTTYPIYIGETQVTSDNVDDVLGDGTVSYDPNTHTLILNGASITDPIAALTDLTIHVIGDSTCRQTIFVGGQTGVTETGDPITTYFDLTISGTASLTWDLSPADLGDGTMIYVPALAAKTITLADGLGLTTDPAGCAIVDLDMDGSVTDDPEAIFVQSIAGADGTFPRTVTIAPAAEDTVGKIVVLMADSCGDGWNGAIIKIYAKDTLVGTAKIEDEEGNYSGIFEMPYDSTAEYRFTWVEGEFPSECTYKIYVNGEEYTGTLDTEEGGSGGETPVSGSVTITGDPVVGQTLTATVSGFDPAAELTYQWYRVAENLVMIQGATESTYTLTENELNQNIYCVVNGVESNRVGNVTSPTYGLWVGDDLTNGTITAGKTIAAEGETVTLIITPDEGYQLKSISINGAADSTVLGKTEVSFTMPAETVEISATFEEGVAVYFDNTDSEWTHVLCADGNGYRACIDLGDSRYGVIVPAGKIMRFTNYMPGMLKEEYLEGYFTTVEFSPENGTTYSVETLRTIHMKRKDDQLTFRDPSAEAGEAVDMILMIAGYHINGQMTDCQVIEDVTGVTEETLTVTGDYIKVFAVASGTYAPIFNSIVL